jgi:small-conductance mechanosensitive channel
VRRRASLIDPILTLSQPGLFLKARTGIERACRNRQRHVIVAVAILGSGMVLARLLSRSVLIAAVNSEIPAARLLGGLTRVAVMVVAGAMALEHLGISREPVLTAFAIVFGGVTLAVSIAAGLAMQHVVRGWVSQQLAPPPAARDSIEHWCYRPRGGAISA